MILLARIGGWPMAVCVLSTISAARCFAAAPTGAPQPLPAATEPATVNSSDWALERVTLRDGTEYRGLVQSETPTRIEFVEVHRRRGKPMFLVVRPIDRRSIDHLQRLSRDEQATLRNRLERHTQRTLIEAARMEDLDLSTRRRDDQRIWQYEGDWFSLESSADESVTRRSIVRLEQIFAAYRQVLRPRWKSPVRLRIRIFGASEPYQEALAALGLAIKNPAVYLQDQHLILAGSDMNRFAAAMDVVDRQHRKIRDQLDLLVTEAPMRIGQLRETLERNQIPAAERQKILAAEQRKWEAQRRDARRKIAELERNNADKFDVVTAQMFRRLAHEALHAYLEIFVYPPMTYDVPRWLNEGLAQTFEAGLLEADTLRIDNPNTIALERLQNDLGGDRPLSLAELLQAGGETFLAGHADDGQRVSRAYYYSWGLAYYLAFEQGVLGTGQFEAYLEPTAGETSPVERFEKLVGQPLEMFEPNWRAAMSALSASR